MATDIAVLGLEIRSDGVVIASDRLRKLQQESQGAESATNKLSTAASSLVGYMKAVAAAMALMKLVDMAKDAALAAARYDTLGVAVNTVGMTAGYSNQQMAGFQAGLEKTGISAAGARQALLQMAQGNVSFAESSKLARAAQDAAVVADINSTEAFNRLVRGISTGQTEVLTSMGVMVNFEKAYDKLAVTLNKSTASLTDQEKVQARVNEVMEKSASIAGLYQAAMGTAGKQILSLQRYLDNLKITVGSVFQDTLLFLVVQATGGLKEMNKEAEDLQKKEFAKWGKDLTLTVAGILDMFVNILDLMNLMSKMNPFATAASAYKDLIDYYQKQSGIDLTDMSKIKVVGGSTKYTDAAKKMYSDREDPTAKAKTEEVKRALDLQLQINGMVQRTTKATDEQNTVIKKNRADWGGIVVSQLESVGLYSEAEGMAIKLNQQTDKYKMMVDATRFSSLAQDALSAQKLLDQNKLLEAKRKELELETTHQTTMQGINSAKLAAKGISSEEVAIMTQRAAMLLEEQKLQDQITTEINPKRKAQLEEQLTAQQSVNYLIREQSELELKLIQLRNSSSAYNDATKLALANGDNSLAKQLAMQATSLMYDQKRLELKKQLTGAMEVGNGDQISALQTSIQQLDILYSQRDANKSNLKVLQDYLGVQTSITDEQKKQQEFGGGKIVKDAEGNDLTVTQKFDRTDANDRTYLNQIFANLKAVMGSGVDGGYSMSLWKQYQAEAGRLQELANQKMIDEQKAANALIVTAMENAAGDLSSAATDLSKSGMSMAAALRSAANKIKDAQLSIATSGTSTLSPEQQYALARQTFLNTAAKAQSTGDVDLYNQLPELAKKLLEMSQSFNASGSNFTADYDMIQAILAESASKAEAQATLAEQTVSLLQQQADLLTKIKEALTTGGDTTNLLRDLNTINGTLNTTMGSVNTSVGQTTAAALATNGTTGTVADNVANNNTLTTSGTNTLAGWLSAVNTQTAATVTYTSGMKNVMSNSLLGSQLAGRVQKVEHRAAAGGATYQNADDTYQYYANGGLYPGGSAIMGEKGAEFVDSSPGYVYRADETKALFDMARRGVSAADGYGSSETVAELKQANVELRAAVKILQTGFTELIKTGNKQSKNMDSIKNTARLAVNQ